MVKTPGNTTTPREPIKTRKTSANSERRNSVSDIAEYFNKGPMAPAPNKVKASNKGKGPNKQPKIKQIEDNNENNESTEDTATKDNSQETVTWEQTMQNNEHDNTDNSQPLNEQGSNEEETSQELRQDNLTEEDNSEHQSEKHPMKDAITQTAQDEVLQLFRALQSQVISLEETINDPKNGLTVQLAKTQAKTSELHTDIHGAVSGLKVKLNKMSEIADSNLSKITALENSQARITALLDENKRLVNELQLMQGVLQRMDQQSAATTSQVLDLTKRGMEQNLIIHGIDNTMEIEDSRQENPMYTSRERCKYAFIDFARKQLDVDVQIEDVWKAHRLGAHRPGKVRPMVVKLAYAAKDLIMEHMGSLKGKTNPKTNQTFFISEQIPEGIAEAKKQVSSHLKTLRDENDKRPKDMKQKIQVINDKILVDDKLDQPLVVPPQPSHLFLKPAEQGKVDLIQEKFIETEPILTKNSEFMALAVKVHSVEEVQRAYIAAVQRFPTADHVILGYAFKQKGQPVCAGFCDNREYGAGNRVKKTIFEKQAKNTAVFVIRKYGGVHLGFERFTAIESAAAQALDILSTGG